MKKTSAILQLRKISTIFNRINPIQEVSNLKPFSTSSHTSLFSLKLIPIPPAFVFSAISMSQYGFSTTGEEVVKNFSSQVKGRTFLVTGPSEGGIGAQTAISLAHASPSNILLLGRSLPKIQPTIDAIHKIDPSITTKFVSVSLDSLSSVREAAKIILADETIPKIDVTINNAAIMACPYGLTQDGFELQFGTNYVSHFLLTNLLMPKILAAAPGAVIVNVSSTGHLFADINYESLDFNKGKDYTPFAAYAQAKTANILFSVELKEKLASKGVKSWALHPGSISSGLQKYMNQESLAEAMKIWWATGRETPERKTLEQGCSTTLRAALDPELKEENGSIYLSDCQIVTDPEWVKEYALDKASASKLWNISEELHLPLVKPARSLIFVVSLAKIYELAANTLKTPTKSPPSAGVLRTPPTTREGASEFYGERFTQTEEPHLLSFGK
ncbi:hypothetical protein G7Y89_g6453 [Cudoniella acicularis]|uniref:Short-chain dehydrogenase n=1 Tax=Cudoniella acicularis TaxID=354080 RepID=A0A8H4W2F0_9HELO|nr:hypothetical protein G7Y89_g6453 [Cudoniella acicularis]